MISPTTTGRRNCRTRDSASGTIKANKITNNSGTKVNCSSIFYV
jgi:hypothetical protein